MSQKPLFTIIMLTFNRPHLLKEAIKGLFAQTYTNLEIIIINNAATLETQEYLAQLQTQDSRVKVVHFDKNQYDPHDPLKFIGICFNAALKAATGEYVFYQEDDDLISPDYVERMVALFQGNPECTTAAGLPGYIDEKGKVIQDPHVKSFLPRISNFRPRYMQGYLLAVDALRCQGRGSVLFSASGIIFTIKREVLIKAGGYHPAIEPSQLYGIVPFGVTGFDEQAFLYWRRHPNQLNLSFELNGYMSLQQHYNLLKEWDLVKKWEDHFGISDAEFLKKNLIRLQIEGCPGSFMHCLYAFSWQGAWRILSQVWCSWHFWKLIPQAAWRKKWVLKATLKKMFKKS